MSATDPTPTLLERRMSFQRRSYAVTWREADGLVRAGKLTLGPGCLRLEGGTARGRLSAQKILFSDLAVIETSRDPAKRIGGRPTILLWRSNRPLLAIACIDDPGSLHELAERLRQAITDTVSA